MRVRLARIDAPEKRQAFGWQAHQTLYSLTFHKNVLVIEAGHDHYGRTVGTIYLGRINVNQELVRRGMAWADRYHSGNPALLHIEAEARALGKSFPGAALEFPETEKWGQTT
ncbi:hypothetical protein AGMMS50256_18780 [Betaproteobacteria bacterium]|nr:hypothetical protein AGMMS50256_18780 [Betaproteobacteria bacterium]